MQEQPTEAQAIVFVVDDDASLRQALDSLLRSVGLRVGVFGSAADFLKHKFLDDAAACLVLDIRLPGLSGLDFQAELAKAGIQIPIIFISGHGDIPMQIPEKIAREKIAREKIAREKIAREKIAREKIARMDDLVMDDLFSL